jgi:hypothetical protein
MNQTDFEVLIGDQSKRVEGDISWSEDEDHSPALEFRTEVLSDPGYPIFIKGSYNALARTLTYALIHRGSGRIYGLDMGKDHHNPTCQFVGEKHKHRWNEPLRDKDAYCPEDITADVATPTDVWLQFCVEAKISHAGIMHSPPVTQLELL